MQSSAMYTDFGALASLRTDARADSGAAMEEVAEQFESLFVQMMLKSMRDATEKGGLFESNQLDSYEQMYDQQLALEMSTQGGIGLAEVIVRQFEGQTASDLSADPSSATPAAQDFLPLSNFRVPSLAMTEASSSRASNAVTSESVSTWRAKSQADFLQHLRPFADSAGQQLGVDPEVLLAQAALETGWGKHVLGNGSRSSNNFFNIKAGSDWTGETVSKQTLEYKDGVAVRETAQFRVYSTPAAAFSDYADFVSGKPRYAAAVEVAGDAQAYLRELQDAGYATDPAYADKIMAVKEQFASQHSKLALKNSADQSITH
ncbi:MAG: flagellar assembly peptidoglycan hydrolase FlgJ [Congregibacter sp.]